jgi:hypothetical protein
MSGERLGPLARVRKELQVKLRVIAGILLLLGLYACGSTEQAQQAMKPAPETEIVLLYSSDDKGEYEECG